MPYLVVGHYDIIGKQIHNNLIILLDFIINKTIKVYYIYYFIIINLNVY